MNTWKGFLSEARQIEYAYETLAAVKYNSSKRNQTFILHDIRELCGVRVVDVAEPVGTHGDIEEVKVLIKHDIPSSFSSLKEYLVILQTSIKAISGVQGAVMLTSGQVELQ
tara:strand:- start:420 stop:752 length:333 start_codon:yes stop_codon:yes gene_type:complete